VVPAAAALGLLGAGARRPRPAPAGLAAAAGGGALRARDAVGARFAPLADGLAGVMGVGGAALVGITLAFPFALGWSAATLGEALGPAPAPAEADSAPRRPEAVRPDRSAGVAPG
jgi:hypothetical protein